MHQAIEADAPPLTADDRQALVMDHLALAYSIALPIARRYPALEEDLLAVARLAAVEAAQRFDPARGLAFGTILGRYVRGRMLQALRSRARWDRTAVLHHDPADDDEPDAPDDLVVELARLREALADLPPRDRKVITMRFGLDGAPPAMLRDVGEALEVTPERARQIERRALERLRARLEGLHRSGGA
jgi:RNA polymerase sigma factor (sigma-70 family)